MRTQIRAVLVGDGDGVSVLYHLATIGWTDVVHGAERHRQCEAVWQMPKIDAR